MYRDTDSFVYHIKTSDLYKDILNPSMVNEFDLSAYPRYVIQFSDVPHFPLLQLQNRNGKMMGKFKDELGELIMDESCFLLSKFYSYKMQVPATAKPLKGTRLYGIIQNPFLGICNLFMKIVAKGVRECIQEKVLNFSHYKKLLERLKHGEATTLSICQAQINVQSMSSLIRV